MMRTIKYDGAISVLLSFGIIAFLLMGSVAILPSHDGSCGAKDSPKYQNAHTCGSKGNFWTAKTPMPTPRMGLGVGVVNGKIYAISGSGTSGYEVANEMYDPAFDNWTDKAPIPLGRSAFAVGVVNGKIYTIGGIGGGVRNEVFEYNPANNKWTPRAPMPTARCNVEAAVISDNIYAMGGLNAMGTNLDTVEVYNTTANTWASKNLMPSPRREFAVGIIDNMIYAIGGWNGAWLTENRVYNVTADSWALKKPMPTARMGVAGGVINNTIYVVGGTQHGVFLNTTEQYDPATDTWTTLPSMPTGRYSLAAGVVNNRLYAIGGNTSVKLTNNEEFTPPGIMTPGAPLNLQAIPGDKTVDLSWVDPGWNGGSAITNFRIYRGTASGTGTFLVEVGYVHAYTDTGLTNGVAYYYNITAKNVIGEGPSSDEVSATPQAGITVPSPPRNLIATPGDTLVTLDWTAPSSDGGSTITNYRIYRGTTSGATSLLIQVGNVLTYVDAPVTNGVKYYYNVTAVNSVGESSSSNEVNATPQAVIPSPPSAPLNLIATPAPSQVTLNWSTPSSDGGSPITNYRIYRGTTSGATSFLMQVGNVLFYVDTSVTNGVKYYYNVAAVNIAGESPGSNEASATPSLTGPGWLTGRVRDDITFDIITGAQIKVNETGSTTTSNATGEFNITLSPGIYNLTATKTGYKPGYESMVEIISCSESFVVLYLKPPTGTLTGTVTDKSTGSPIQYAIVKPSGYLFGASTDSAGKYTMTDLPVGDYIVNTTWILYKNASKNATIYADQTTVLDFQLEKEDIVSKATVIGTVIDIKTKQPIESATVTIGSSYTMTNSSGEFYIMVDPGTYTIKISKSGYEDATKQQTFAAGYLYTLDAELVPISSGPLGGGFNVLWLIIIIAVICIVIPIVVIVVWRSKAQKQETVSQVRPMHSQGAPVVLAPPAMPPVPIQKDEILTGQLNPIEQQILDMVKQHPGADPRWLARVLDLRLDNLRTHIRGLTNAGYLTVLKSEDKDDIGYYIAGTEPASVLVQQSQTPQPASSDSAGSQSSSDTSTNNTAQKQ